MNSKLTLNRILSYHLLELLLNISVSNESRKSSFIVIYDKYRIAHVNVKITTN